MPLSIRSISTITIAVLALALPACDPRSNEPSVSDTAAWPAPARTFLSTLNASQRATASFPFDNAERTNWAYVPQRRAGLPLRDMNDEQRAAAFALLGTGLSERGTMLAQGVIELEGTLRELEGCPKEGHRLLAGEEDLGFALVNMLDTLQRSRAIIAAQPYGDVVTGSDPAVQSMAFAGLPALEMTVDQKTQLRTLLELYASRMADSSAARQMRRIEEVGFDRLHFAWAGATQPGEGHYYRIHGPTVLVEFDNSFGNHIHSVWRDLEHDFGGDLLRKHYARHAHGK